MTEPPEDRIAARAARGWTVRLTPVQVRALVAAAASPAWRLGPLPPPVLRRAEGAARRGRGMRLSRSEAASLVGGAAP